MDPRERLARDPDLAPRELELVEEARTLARERFAPRAEAYDRTTSFPREDFDDLFATGLTAAAVPIAHRGLGFAPPTNPLPLWLITRALASADLSLARCFEGHANSMVLLAGLATAEQQARFFAGVVDRGERWAAWSGEPRTPAPGEAALPAGTTVRVVAGGFVVAGAKVFATSAGAAEWALLLVNPAGPGGARHAGEAAGSVLLLACDLTDPSIEVDTRWWDPIGMRATVSHRVIFHDTFIPASNLIGPPGAYLSDGWQAAFVPHYAASFLGAAEAAYAHARAHLAVQSRGADPYVQQRVARMAIAVQTGDLWLRHVARLWRQDHLDAARIAGSAARHLVEHLAEETVHHAIRACGARSLIRPAPLERILRDLTFYLRHDNDDHVLATIGRAILGRDHDLSFYNP